MASGGMASVHLGRLVGPVGFSKIVAIKRLHEQFATDPEFLAMFIDEARLASAISHPNVVSSLDVVVEHDELLLVMEYVQGETLAQLVRLARKRHERPALGVVQRILCDTLDGLHAAHTASVGGRALNIVHRDVSPQNIMVGVNGVARVLDFGIAKAASQSQTTRPGKVKGKFAYLSPEQLRGLPVDPRTDVFSAGVVLWESLTGVRLFLVEDLEETAKRVLNAVVAPPSSLNPEVPKELDQIVLKALNRDRDQRYETAAEFADALRGLPGEASRGEVGAWVSATAGAILAQRLEALQELEAMDVAHVGVAPSSPPPSVRGSSAPAHTPPSLAARPVDDAATISSSVVFTSPGTTRALTPRSASAWPHKLRWALAAGSLALLLGGVGLFATRPNAAGAKSALEPRATPPTRAAAEASPPPSLSAPQGSAVAASDPTSAVPIVQVEQLAPAPLPSKPESANAVVPAPRRASPSTAARTRSPAVDCNPPYRIDASGVRRVRFECL
jgi:serine/threonine-protein kinase